MIKVLQNPRKKKKFARLLKKIKKSHSLKDISPRELSYFPFIGDKIFKTKMFATITDAVIGSGIAYKVMHH